MSWLGWLNPSPNPSPLREGSLSDNQFLFFFNTMNKVRKTLGSLFRVQETEDATEATTAEATTEETPESADETTETDETEEEESTSEASTDETTTVEATTTVAETVTMSLAAYNKLKADADSVPGLSKKIGELTEKAKKWDAHQAAVQGITPSGDLNSSAEVADSDGDAETKRLKGRYGKLID